MSYIVLTETERKVAKSAGLDLEEAARLYAETEPERVRSGIAPAGAIAFEPSHQAPGSVGANQHDALDAQPNTHGLTDAERKVARSAGITEAEFAAMKEQTR